MLLKYNTMCTQNSYHKICEECGKEFITLMPTTHYCSDRCSKLAYKHRKRDERLNNTTLEVRERQRLALLDKDFLTLSDAARLMQMSRNTLYKIIRDNEIQLKRFTDRTVRIARADLDKASEGRSTGINTTAPGMTDNLGKWITREQVMEKYDVTYSWFYSTLKKRGVKTHMIGTLGFYDRDTMHRLFGNQEYQTITEWYTFDELRQTTGMRTESICDFIKDHKIPMKKKNNVTYVSKTHWDEARGTNIDLDEYYTISQIMDRYQISRNHLFCVLRDSGITRIKRGNFVYLPKEEVDKALAYRLEKLN